MRIFASCQCARVMWVQVRRVTFAVGRPRTRRSCLVLVVFEPQWPRCAVVPSHHLHRQGTLLSAHLSESSISECVRLCDVHNYGLFHMVCNNIPRDIPERDPPRTYVHTHLVRIGPRFRASRICARQSC